MSQKFTNMEQLLDRIAEAARNEDQISLGTIVEEIGNRSFGPLLLLIGIILASPLSGIPGLPTSLASLVTLIAIQLVIGRRHFWMPRSLLKRSIARERCLEALEWLRPPARFVDRWVRPRLTVLVRRTGRYVIAIICTLIAAGMPVMELVPFSATSAGIALTAFGLSLVSHDGLLALLAFALTAATLGLAAWSFL